MRTGSWWRRPAVRAAVVVAVWLIAGGPLGGFQGRLSEVQINDQATFLPATAEATQVAELLDRFGEPGVISAVVAYERPGGLTGADRAHLEPVARQVGELAGVVAVPAPPVVSEDAAAAQLVVQLDESDATDTVAAIRDVVGAAAPPGLAVYVTGPAGFVADLSGAFGNIDGLLLAVTATAVAVILVVVYRSPLLPLVVLLGAGLALGVASAAVYALASTEVVVLNGQSQGIMLILVFGAATDYALLLVARFREELARQPDRFTAVGVAWRRSVGPILASGSTVILGLLCLLLSDLNSNRGLGPVAAVGIGAALLVMLTYLPAVLSLLGRAGFWPFRPPRPPASAPGEAGQAGGTAADQGSTRRAGLASGAPADQAVADSGGGWWRRLAGFVVRRARAVWVVTLLVLAGLAALAPQLDAGGVPESDLFIGGAEATSGQEALARHFPAGATAPTQVVTGAGQVAEVVAAARGVSGVAGAQPVAEAGDLALVQVVLADPPDSDAAVDTVGRLRSAVHAVPGADALVGGTTAVDLDTRDAARRDLVMIIPLVLVVVLLVIIWLLRAVVAPALILASVVLSFAATLGLAAVAFQWVFGFPGADPSLPLFGFVFLVALGVDYSIFLMTRVREEAARRGTRAGVQEGLAVTGGVITSAGVVLAATFASLSVLPLLFLIQIAFIVAVGVLIDTMVVRTLLVPALCVELGPRVWWPGRLSRS